MSTKYLTHLAAIGPILEFASPAGRIRAAADRGGRITMSVRIR